MLLHVGIAGYVIALLIFGVVLYGFLRYTKPQGFIKPFFSTYIAAAAGTLILGLYAASPWWIFVLCVVPVAFRITPID